MSIPSLSSVMGIDMRNTYRYIHELVYRKIIYKEWGKQMRFNNNYETWVDATKIHTTTTETEVKSVKQVVLNDITLNDTVVVSTKPIKPKKEKKEFDKSIVTESFWKFWNGYPKVRRYNLPIAFDIWKEVNPNGSISDKILEALDTFKASDNWIKENGKYIPAVINFLKHRRWETLPEPKEDWR
jgi:hypothetical protein